MTVYYTDNFKTTLAMVYLHFDKSEDLNPDLMYRTHLLKNR